jgi:hypothetical protein
VDFFGVLKIHNTSTTFNTTCVPSFNHHGCHNWWAISRNAFRLVSPFGLAVVCAVRAQPARPSLRLNFRELIYRKAPYLMVKTMVSEDFPNKTNPMNEWWWINSWKKWLIIMVNNGGESWLIMVNHG